MAADLSHYTQISHLYLTVLGRVPDSGGLAFWADALADGMPLEDITRDFLQTAEAQAGYPNTGSADEFVANFYEAVFNRAPDAAGLQFWTDAMWSRGGPQSFDARAFIVQALVQAVSTPLTARPEGMSEEAFAQTQVDRTIFANKVEVSLFFGLERETSFEQTRGVLALVDATPGSVDVAKDFDPTQPTPNPNPNPNPNPDPGPAPIDQTYTKNLSEIYPSATPFSGTTGENDTLILRGIDKSLVEGAVTRGIETVNIDEVRATLDSITVDAGVFEDATQIGVGDEIAFDMPFTLTGMADKTLRLYSELPSDSEEKRIPFTPMGYVVVDHGEAESATVVLDSPRTYYVSFTGEALETISLSGSGTVSMQASGITTLNIAADGEGLNVQGNGDAFANLKTIDASASVADVQTNGVLPDTYKGGAGMDWLYIVSDYLGDRSLASLDLDGGEGDEDRLNFDLAGVDVGELNHRNIEQLHLYNANLASYDISGFKLTYVYASLKNSLALTQAEAGSTLQLGGEYLQWGAQSGPEITYSLATDTADDVLNIAFDWMVRDAVVNADKIETLNIDSDTDSVTSTITIAGDSLTRIELDGAGRVELNLDRELAGLAITVDASGLAGGLKFGLLHPDSAPALEIIGATSAENELQAGAAGSSLKGGSADDTLIGGNGDDTLYGGGGTDFMVGGEGSDTFILGPSSSVDMRSEIADFSLGEDRILLEMILPIGTAVENVVRSIVDSALSLQEAVAQILGGAAGVDTSPVVHYFNHQESTFILVDVAPGTPNFVDGQDQLIELVGQVQLTARDGFIVESVQ